MDAPKRLGRPRRGTEGDINLRMLEAATPVFLKDGFEGTSIDAVVAAAEVSKKTFYSRFSGKEDLFEAVCVRFIEQNIRPIERISDDAKGSAGERLHRIALSLLEAALKPETILFRRITIAEAVRFPRFAQTLFDFGFPRISFLVQTCLEDGVGSGELCVPDVRFAAEFFLHAAILSHLDRATTGLDKPGVSHTKREVLKRSVDFFLAACRPGSRSPNANSTQDQGSSSPILVSE